MRAGDCELDLVETDFGFEGEFDLDMLTRFPNVYADTSGVRRCGYLVAADRRAGPAKLILGSDGPWLHPGLELHKIRLLGLSPADETAVLGGTLRGLLARAEKGRDRVRAGTA